MDEDEDPERDDERDDREDRCGDGHLGAPCLPAPYRHRVVVVREDEREEQAVEAIEDATVSGNNPARILGAEGPLERRLAQVAQLRQHADAQRHAHRLALAEHREEHYPADERDDDGARQAAEGALHGLARADAWHELASAPRPAGEVAARVRAHRRVDGEEYPPPAVGLLAEQCDVRAKEAHIEDAEEQEAQPVDRDRKSTRLNSSHLGISYA